MVRWLRWHCPPDTGFEIRALAVWGRARYLSVTEAPHNTDFHTWMGKKHFCFFQTAETGNRTPDSGVKGSGANHYPTAPAQIGLESDRTGQRTLASFLVTSIRNYFDTIVLICLNANSTSSSHKQSCTICSWKYCNDVGSKAALTLLYKYISVFRCLSLVSKCCMCHLFECHPKCCMCHSFELHMQDFGCQGRYICYIVDSPRIFPLPEASASSNITKKIC